MNRLVIFAALQALALTAFAGPLVPPPPALPVEVDPNPNQQPVPSHIPTPFIVIEVGPFANVREIAGQVGCTVREYDQVMPIHVLVAPSADLAVMAKAKLEMNPMVTYISVLSKGMNEPHWMPNDPYFKRLNPPTTFPGQWHLYNWRKPGLDANVTPVWDTKNFFATEYRGAGIVTSILEEGVVMIHQDLFNNWNATHSWDYVDDNNNPEPGKFSNNNEYTDEHGTNCAGIIAAVGGNNLGVTGIAPESDMSPIRFSFTTDPDELAAITRESYNNDEDIDIKSHSYGYEVPFYGTTDVAQQITYSSLVNTIHTRSAGNYRGGRGQDSTSKPQSNSRYTINVAALGYDGKFADYSNYGSNVFCTAPSRTNNIIGIGTTDTPGESGYNEIADGANNFPNRDYNNNFGGTSAACPIVAGVLALAKDAQPNMNARMAQHLLVKTCKKVDPNDTSGSSYGGWRANAAGIEFNPNYGFGLIDAAALVDAAKQYTGVTPDANLTSGLISTNVTIPDNNINGEQVSFTFPNNAIIENVQVFVNWKSERNNDLELFVRSPQGYWSKMLTPLSTTGYTYDDVNWTRYFVTNAFWGQGTQGQWTVLLRDRVAGKTTLWNNVQVLFYTGSLTGTVKTLKGTVSRGAGFVGGEYGTNGQLTMYKDGAVFPSKVHHVTIQEDGSYSLPSTVSNGIYDIYLRTDHWLLRKRTNITVTDTGATVNFSLTNGDCNGDNYIGTDDYLILNSAFDTTPDDWLWDARGDLNDDGYVGTDDYLIINTNFDRTGD